MGLAVFLRVLGIDKSLWYDEVSSLIQADAADFIAAARGYDHPPLYFAILRIGLHFTHSYAWLRVFSVVCGAGTVAAFCFLPLSKHRIAGWCAALLIATSPLYVANSQEMRQYALLSLELAFALLFATRLIDAPRSTGWAVGLACALAAAAATHLIAIFFVASLAAVTLWLLRRQRLGDLFRVALAFAPAGALALFFKYHFLKDTSKSPENWWMPAPSLSLLRDVFERCTGYTAVRRVADACSMHVRGSGALLQLIVVTGAAWVGWIAWVRRPAGLAHAMLAIALIYWGLICAYSIAAVPLIWDRTMLPGMLPFAFGLGLGVAGHPSARMRAGALAALSAIACVGILPWVGGRAWKPAEDLRGFTAALRQNWRENDLIVYLNQGDSGVLPYWPDYASHPMAKINLLETRDAVIGRLNAVLEERNQRPSIFLVYRYDFAVSSHKAVLDEMILKIGQDRSKVEIWDRDDYHILRFDAANAGR